MKTSIWQNRRVFVTGHRGMVGSALVRALEKEDCANILTAPREQLDLCNQQAVNEFFEQQKPDVVLFAAGRVGGIHANNTYPAEFIHQNLLMGVNSIDAAWRNNVERFLYLGSTCVYPKNAPQPMPESCLLQSPLEKTNEAYAIAKIAGLKMCEFYRKQYGVLFHSAMPTNLYGPEDNYHPENSHVLPALIRRFHEAVTEGRDAVTIWGSGTPRREFLYVDDLADGLLFLCEQDDPPDVVNAGTGNDVTILELAQLIAQIVGFTGEILTDPSQPDGTPLKQSDVSTMSSMGWRASTGLEDGIRLAYKDFLSESVHGALREV